MRLPPQSAARSIAVCLLTLVFASLLNARGIRKTAEIQQPGIQRDVALAVARPLVDVSSFLHLTAPRVTGSRRPSGGRAGIGSTRRSSSRLPPAKPATVAGARDAAPPPGGAAALHGGASSTGLGRGRLARRGAGAGAPAGRGLRGRHRRRREPSVDRSRASGSLQLVPAHTGRGAPARAEGRRVLVRRRRRSRLPRRRAEGKDGRAARQPVVGRGVPAPRRWRHARAGGARHLRRLARPADPRRLGLPAQLPDRQPNPRIGCEVQSATRRPTSTRGSSSTTRTAATRPTCGCTAS